MLEWVTKLAEVNNLNNLNFSETIVSIIVFLVFSIIMFKFVIWKSLRGKMMITDKRGVSPMIGIVILVAVAIIVAVAYAYYYATLSAADPTNARIVLIGTLLIIVPQMAYHLVKYFKLKRDKRDQESQKNVVGDVK